MPFTFDQLRRGLERAEFVPRRDATDVEYRVCSGEQCTWVRLRGAPRRDADGRIVRW